LRIPSRKKQSFASLIIYFGMKPLFRSQKYSGFGK
jgi:hypothetical protein